MWANCTAILSYRGLEKSLILSAPDASLIDQLSFPEVAANHSFGRQPDGSVDWVFFYQPTPLSANTSASYTFAEIPRFSIAETYLANSTAIHLSCPQPGCQIRYTTDGRIPTDTDLLYEQPIHLDTTTALRIRAFAPGFEASEVVSRTYFIGESHSLPIAALITEPHLLFDNLNGLFQRGPNAEPGWPYLGANFWKDTEIPMHFEYLDSMHQLVLSYSLGFEMHGGRGARTKPMKPFRLITKKEFGIEKITYPFFGNQSVDCFERLVFRNASGDYGAAHMRDAFLATYFIDEELNLDVLAAQPVVVYINGVYHGLYNLREKSDQYYLKYHYGIHPDTLDLLEEDSIIAEGNLDSFNAMEAFVLHADLTDSTQFQIASTYFDLENVADYWIAQTAVNNFDWPANNLKFWRERKPGARWRYLLFDQDAAMSRFGWTTPDANSLATKLVEPRSRHVPLFNKLLTNQNYRHYFINRYADLLNTTFRPEPFKVAVKSYVANIAPEMPRQLDRWEGDLVDWQEVQIPKLLDFAERRAPFARQHIQEQFDLEGEVLLRLDVYPKGAGRIQINTITPATLPWDGYYFKGVPVQLSVESAAGFSFIHWESEQTILTLNPSKMITVDFNSDDHIVAVFKTDVPAKAQLNLQLHPNPANTTTQVHFELPQAGAVNLRLYTVSGQLLQEVNYPRLVPGSQRIELDIQDLARGLYMVEVQTVAGRQGRKLVKQE